MLRPIHLTLTYALPSRQELRTRNLCRRPFAFECRNTTAEASEITCPLCRQIMAERAKAERQRARAA